MSANLYPIYSRAWDIQIAGSVIGPTANTNTDGTMVAGCNLIFTADPIEGGFVYKVILKPITTVAATVARVFYCSNTAGPFVAGQTNGQLNTALLAEQALAAWTLSQTAASPQYEIPINIGMPANTKLLMTFGTSTGAANNGYNPIVIAGKY